MKNIGRTVMHPDVPSEPLFTMSEALTEDAAKEWMKRLMFGACVLQQVEMLEAEGLDIHNCVHRIERMLDFMKAMRVRKIDI
jgi:hypothetical protein